MSTPSTITTGGMSRQILATGAIAQLSTNATVNVAGAEIDARFWRSISYTIIVATNAVTWSVWGANVADYSDESIVQNAASVAVGTNGTYSVLQAPFAFYRAKIIDTVGGTHGTATVNGLGKS